MTPEGCVLRDGEAPERDRTDAEGRGSTGLGRADDGSEGSAGVNRQDPG